MKRDLFILLACSQPLCFQEIFDAMRVKHPELQEAELKKLLEGFELSKIVNTSFHKTYYTAHDKGMLNLGF